MKRETRYRSIAALMALLAAAGTAEARRAFGDKVHAALAATHHTRAEISDERSAATSHPRSSQRMLAPVRREERLRRRPTRPWEMPNGGKRSRGVDRQESGADEGSYVVFASISVRAARLPAARHLPLAPRTAAQLQAEFIGRGVTTGTLFAQTPPSVPASSTSEYAIRDPGSSVAYRFLQLTAIPVGRLTRTKLP
jgi:hypothetical protein